MAGLPADRGIGGVQFRVSRPDPVRPRGQRAREVTSRNRHPILTDQGAVHPGPLHNECPSYGVRGRTAPAARHSVPSSCVAGGDPRANCSAPEADRDHHRHAVVGEPVERCIDKEGHVVSSACGYVEGDRAVPNPSQRPAPGQVSSFVLDRSDAAMGASANGEIDRRITDAARSDVPAGSGSGTRRSRKQHGCDNRDDNERCRQTLDRPHQATRRIETTHQTDDGPGASGKCRYLTETAPSLQWR